jgi:stage III sporulation protein AE
VVYTGILLLLLESFSTIGTVVEEGVAAIVSFMTAFIPTYAATLLLTGNAVSAGVFYELAFGMIYLLELGMKLLFLPGIHLFVLLLLLDNLFEETKLSKLAGLLEDGIRLVLRLGVGVVMGLGVVQSLIAPARDRLAASGLFRGLSAMPGVGNTFGAAGELLVGCGIMIKNSVGVAALVVLAVICLTPLLKVFCFHVMYRLTAALLEPFCDRRIAECVQDVGRGCALYLRLLRDVLLLFWITVAMIGASTSFIY